MGFGLAISLTALAGEVRILVQSSPLAGFRYYAGETLWHEMREGDRLTLVRETDNEHDRGQTAPPALPGDRPNGDPSASRPAVQ